MNHFKSILGFLFPPKCIFCRTLLDGEGDGSVCPKCLTELPFLKGGARLTRGAFFSVCVTPLAYEGVARRSILRFKFGGKGHYARGYARLLARCATEYGADMVDLISWAPVSAKRERERGYDQARLLAEETSILLGLPFAVTLVKTTDNKPQSGLTAGQRRANVLGVYEISPGADIGGKRILLIDDVVTTGSTLSECARVLLTAGAAGVACAALAKTCGGKKKRATT